MEFHESLSLKGVIEIEEKTFGKSRRVGNLNFGGTTKAPVCGDELTIHFTLLLNIISLFIISSRNQYHIPILIHLSTKMPDVL